MWESTDFDFWMSEKENLISDYKRLCRLEDIEEYRLSTFCQINITRAPADSAANFLISKCSFTVNRTFAQLRMASRYTCIFIHKGFLYKLDPNQVCSICNLNENETITHFILKCPIYNCFRQKFLSGLITLDNDDLNLEKIVNENDVRVMKNVFYYIVSVLRTRAFIMNY